MPRIREVKKSSRAFILIFFFSSVIYTFQGKQYFNALFYSYVEVLCQSHPQTIALCVFACDTT